MISTTGTGPQTKPEQAAVLLRELFHSRDRITISEATDAAAERDISPPCVASGSYWRWD
jgi:hypothetical protein